MNIQKIFTKIRTALNDKEDKILMEVDKKYDEIFIKEDITKNFEKLPNKIKLALEKGKNIEKEWKENINLNSIIYDCINIENNINEINKINNDIKKCHLNQKNEIKFNLDENKLQDFIEEIKALGQITTEEEEYYNNYKIEVKNPIYTLNNHSNNVLCLAVIKDGRLVSGARDYKIIIYNKTTYHPDLIIKEHNGAICCICPLNSGILASCSEDRSIKLFNIEGNKYTILQILNYHKDTVYKIINFDNNNLISCSKDSSIILC
jgi:WD40 repeat protein